MPVFLKYGDIKGEASEPAHRSWIELISFSYGNRVGGGPARSLNDIFASKRVDSTSPQLYQAAIQGKPVDAILDLVGPEGNVFVRYVMSETVVSSFSSSSRGGDDAVESLTLSFTKIVLQQTPGTPPP